MYKKGKEMEAGQKPVYYSEYLNLKGLLETQKPVSAQFGKEGHDEMLFIIVHQVYELWFKQILHELNSMLKIFSREKIEEREVSKCVSALDRIIKIQGLLINQFDVLETMTPMDFLDFRDLLMPASGFQSLQFREIEIKMGLIASKRSTIDRAFFLGRFNDKEKSILEQFEKEGNLFSQVESWLERMPFTRKNQFDFWNAYISAVEEMLSGDKKIVLENPTLSGTDKAAQLERLEESKNTFLSLLSSESHNKLVSEGKRKLSQKASLNALFIMLYRDEALLTQPYNLLKRLIDIDENFTAWRHRHALMARRMLGSKIGTGGTSGHEYLKRAADNNQVFSEFFDLSTFLIPRNKLPELPKNLKVELNFNYDLRV